MEPRALIQRYQTGEATADEVQELDALLAGSAELRRQFVAEASLDASLREIALERASQVGAAKTIEVNPVFRRFQWSMAAAVVVVIVAIGLHRFSHSDIVATLESSENSAWESEQPIALGSKLKPGVLKLVAGGATLRFQSGAILNLEAPAEIELQSAMRGKLLAGVAVVDVPEPAIGFVIETPNGFAVDHGTQFAVRVPKDRNESFFEVLKGEISVHQTTTERSLLLEEGHGALISGENLRKLEDLDEGLSMATATNIVRLGTGGRATSVIGNDKRKRYLSPDLLTVKHGFREKWERRAFFSFDLAPINLNAVASARLRLNMVPSGHGYASRLPKTNTFAIYGVTQPDKENWKLDSTWAESPGPEDGVLLGKFSVPRSQQNGNVGIATPALLNFLKSRYGQSATLLIVRVTGVIDDPGAGTSLVHAFASDTHPEAAGPTLELTLNENLN